MEAKRSNQNRRLKAYPAKKKRYACKKCRFETIQSTNHYGNTWSNGNNNICPYCHESGEQTIWVCLESPPDEPALHPYCTGHRTFNKKT